MKQKIAYMIKYNEDTGIYASSVPEIESIRFSGYDKTNVEDLTKDAIGLYMEMYPDHLKDRKMFEYTPVVN